MGKVMVRYEVIFVIDLFNDFLSLLLINTLWSNALK